MEEIKPVYRELAHPDLLIKCLHGKTQNMNKVFNSNTWIWVLKNVYQDITFKCVRCGYIMEQWKYIQIESIKTDMSPGKNTATILKEIDKLHIVVRIRCFEHV